MQATRMSPMLCAAFACLLTTACEPATAAVGGLSSAKFNTMPMKLRMAVALAALAGRAAKLENFAFAARGHDAYFRGAVPTGADRVATSLKFRCIGQSFWLHLRTDLEPQGKFWTNFYTSWNGRTERGISYQPAFKVAECVTSDHPFNFRRNLCMDILGLRVDTALYNTTLDHYLRRAMANKWQRYRVWAASGISGRYLVVRVWTGGRGFSYEHCRQFWLDEGKGFMPCRFTNEYFNGHRRLFRQDAEVLSSTRAAGVWLPTRIRETDTSVATPGLRGIDEYRLSHFKIGKLTNADLKLRFPLNSLRLNLIRMRCYFVNKKGIASPRPLYIPQVGRVLIPSPPKLAPIPVDRIGARGGTGPGGAPGGAGVAFRFTTGRAVSVQGDRLFREIFPFKNSTGQMVHISKITTSCSCTSAAASSKIIRPGAEGKIVATVKLKGLPPHSVRYITVYEIIGSGPLPVHQKLKLFVKIMPR